MKSNESILCDHTTWFLLVAEIRSFRYISLAVHLSSVLYGDRSFKLQSRKILEFNGKVTFVTN